MQSHFQPCRVICGSMFSMKGRGEPIFSTSDNVVGFNMRKVIRMCGGEENSDSSLPVEEWMERGRMVRSTRVVVLWSLPDRWYR